MNNKMSYLVTLKDGSKRKTDANNFHTYIRINNSEIGHNFESRRAQLSQYLNATAKDWEIIDE